MQKTEVNNSTTGQQTKEYSKANPHQVQKAVDEINKACKLVYGGGFCPDCD